MSITPTDLPSLNHLLAGAAPEGTPPFQAGIVIGPGFISMDMVGLQTVFAVVPGAVVHLLWKTHDPVEGYPNWWTVANTTFDECPAKLDVLAVPMLAPEVQTEPKVVAFIAEKAKTASYIAGVCNGVVSLGAAGLLKDRRATSNHNALPLLRDLGVSEVVPASEGVVIDRKVYTAGPGVGSYEVALRIVEAAFGLTAAQFAELAIEYDPRPMYGTGNLANADPAMVAQFERVM